MNVLIITAVGGFLPKFLMQDVQLLIERGHVVHYATNFANPVYECDEPELEAMGVKCFNIPIAKSPLGVKNNHLAYKKLKQIVNDSKIDLVYAHNPMGGVLGRVLTYTNSSLKVIYTAHGFHFYKGAPLRNWILYYPVEKFLAKKTDVLITINHEDEELSKQFTLKPGGFVKRIPGTGVDTKRFYSDDTRKAFLREKHNIRDDEFIYLSVGELNDNKNHSTIIKSFASANMPNARLYICGEGPNHRSLQRQINGLGVKGRVKLCGYQHNIEDYYRMADAFVFPSIREGMGMASLEAMACGLPLIVADNRGTREYARDNAIVCKAQDADGFRLAMSQLYYDHERKVVMGHKSLTIAPEFAKSETIKIMEEIFGRLEAAYVK